nr:hypothetical protein [Campylobacter sp. RM6914]
MQRWFPEVPVWVFATFFTGLIFVINLLNVRAFGETESFLRALR